MERFRDFGLEYEVEGVCFVEGAVRLSTASYRDTLALTALKGELESYLAPTQVIFATISTVPNETFVISYEKTIAGEINILDNGVIAFWRDPRFVNRGLVTRALKLLIDNYKHYPHFTAFVLPDNLASKNALTKNNFISKGISAEQFFVDGQWREHEEFVYTIEK